MELDEEESIYFFCRWNMTFEELEAAKKEVGKVTGEKPISQKMKCQKKIELLCGDMVY